MQSKTVEQKLAEVDAYMEWRDEQIRCDNAEHSPEDYRQHLTSKLAADLLDTLVLLVGTPGRPWDTIEAMREQIALARA